MLAVRDPFRVSVLLLLSALCAASASALPISLYADATASTGFAPADVARAVAAGAGAPAVVVGLGDGDGYFQLTTSNGHPGAKGKGKSKRKPSCATSSWTLHVAPETPADLLRDFWVVILGHSPNDPFEYETKNVGLAIDSDLPWRLVTPWEGGPAYLAYQLGDLAAGRSYEIPIEHRLGQRLEKRRGVYYFPLYSVAYLSLPEPGTWLLGLAGVACAVRAVRRPGAAPA